MSATRNLGLRHARGEFVAFMDSDDLWRPNHVAACVEALLKEPEAVAAYGEHGLVDAEGRVIEEYVIRPAYEGDEFRRALCLKRLILHPTEVVVRRSALEAAYGSTEVFDPEAVMLEEWLVWVTLLRSSDFRRVGRPTVWRRLHPNSTWGNPDKFARQSVRATEKVIATGLPEALGIPGRRILAVNRTHCAYGYYLAGRFADARRELSAALREYPPVVRERHFWSVAARLCVGKRLSQSIRSARHRGREGLADAEGATTKP
jgi:glycosyltransferase involved in cell wall biosynthesis